MRGLMIVAMIALATAAAAQQIPPPSGPVLFCGVQALPAGDTYTVRVDGGEPQPVTLTAPDARCPAGATHAFTLPASLFPIGDHSVQVIAANAFGATAGPVYAVVVGIAPGAFTITAVLPPGE